MLGCDGLAVLVDCDDRRGSVEKSSLLDNLELVLLTLDELVDNGVILEIDPLAIANRVLMQGQDGEGAAGKDWGSNFKGRPN